MKRVIFLTVVALLAMLVFAPVALAQGTTMMETTGVPLLVDGGGPSLLLSAAALLLESGVLTYAILRRIKQQSGAERVLRPHRGGTRHVGASSPSTAPWHPHSGGYRSSFSLTLRLASTAAASSAECAFSSLSCSVL